MAQLDLEHTNPWRLDDVGDPGLAPAQATIPEDSPMPQANKKDTTLLTGFICIAGLGLACGLFVAAFMIPIKLVGLWLG